MKHDGKRSATSDGARRSGQGVTDTAVRKATGKGWGDWFDLLDTAGAREMTHQQIVAVVGRTEPNAWWQQMIAEVYEQARSLRDRHQREDGLAAKASKIIRAGVTRVYAAWAEDALRAAWLEAEGWHVRKATPCKSLRITWTDGHTHLEVHLWPRSIDRTLVQVEHSRLTNMDEVHRLQTFWTAALERLRGFLETADHPHSLAA